MTDIFENKTQVKQNGINAWAFIIPGFLMILLALFLFLYISGMFSDLVSKEQLTRETKVFNPRFHGGDYSKREHKTSGSPRAIRGKYASYLSTPVNLHKYKALFMAAPDNATTLATTMLTVIDKDEDPVKIAKKDKSSVMHFDVHGRKAAFLEINQKNLEKKKEDYLATEFKIDNNLSDFSVLDATAVPLKDKDKKVYYRNLSLNTQNNSVLFNALDTSYKGKRVPHLASKWDIYILDIKTGRLRFVTHGMYPNWLSNSTFAYVGDEGLYIYNTVTKHGRLMYKTPGNTKGSSDMYMTVNEDKDLLAWAFPSLRYMMVYSIKDAKIGILRELKKISGISAILPVFSQDSRVIAFVDVPDYDKFSKYGPNTTSSYFKVYDFWQGKNIKTPISGFDLNKGNNMSTFQLNALLTY